MCSSALVAWVRDRPAPVGEVWMTLTVRACRVPQDAHISREDDAMDVLGFISLTITGFTSCAEFGSYVRSFAACRKSITSAPSRDS
jgi:hypothetical protein